MLIEAGERGVDYAFGRPTPEQLRRNGYRFVVRYISVPPASAAKNITRAERDALLKAGIGILLVWEMSATTADQGASRGTIDGTAARRILFDIGYPVHVPALVAVDTDTYFLNIAAHEAYVRAFAAAVSPFVIGVYGDADILLRVGNLSQIGWLPNAPAWSAANRQKAIDAGLVHVLQRKGYSMEGVAVDPNDVIRPIVVWVSWTPTPPPPLPTPSPTPQEDDVPILIQPDDGDAAVFAVDGLTASWAVSGEVIGDLALAKILSTSQVVQVPRRMLKALHYKGPLPDYTGIDPDKFPRRTDRGDFASHDAVTPSQTTSWPVRITWSGTGNATPTSE